LLTLRYRSGEEIRKGDRVCLNGNPAEIELVSSDPANSDPQVAWYMKEFGGGVLILEPIVFGRLFIPSDQLEESEDLEFISRGPGEE
jgi:hypothetical protein